MGVRGLTSYIAHRAELYLKPYELHDCHLVIDGDNLACNLYKDATGAYSAFGGDYDDFFRAVIEFFSVLAECNIHAYVLMDGGYEYRKLRTVGQRMRGKIAVIKKINPCGSIPIFPVLLKEVFVDALHSCGVPVMRCAFEADDELAALGRKLNCPVLSYDSDFYIHNVRYIPLITLTIKAHTKRVKEHESETRKLNKTEARRVEKRTKANRIVGDIMVDNLERRAPKTGLTYKFIDCCIYRVDNLIMRGSLSEDKLPLFAAMLGNDYIARSAFKNFFTVGMGKIGRSKKLKQQQRRIRIILKWLKTETVESALEKILSRLQKSQRESLSAQVKAATSGYSNEICRSYDFFVANYENAFKCFPKVQELVERSERAMENEDQLDDEELDGSELEVDSDEQYNWDDIDTASDDKDIENCTEGMEDSAVLDQDKANDNTVDKIESLPVWFIEKLYLAQYPRFFVDLMHLRKYINNPQVEHFPYNDCNEVALPILIYIFTLLNSVKESKNDEVDDNAAKPYFTYMTRATRVTNVRYYRCEMGEPPKYHFNPNSPNPLLMRSVFEGSMHNLDADFIFERVNMLPNDLQLYLLAIVYWLHKSQHCDQLHLHSLVICLVVMRTIDSKIPAERDINAFHNRFGKIIKKERLVRSKEELEGTKRQLKQEIRALSIPDRMHFVPKSDCYLVQAELLKHFHMQEIFKKKYDLYSSIVIHAFAEFQSILFQLQSLNGLLACPYSNPHLGQIYCGVFLYNLYDLLRTRPDVRYYAQHFIFRDSQMMFDFYTYLLDWCEVFVPEWKCHWKHDRKNGSLEPVNKKLFRKQRQAARKQANQVGTDPQVLPQNDNSNPEDNTEDDEFFDLNNKFCELLTVR